MGMWNSILSSYLKYSKILLLKYLLCSCVDAKLDIAKEFSNYTRTKKALSNRKLVADNDNTRFYQIFHTMDNIK